MTDLDPNALDAAADKGAAKLVEGEPAPFCVGDVLHDHDWTPMEAARAVLEVGIPAYLAALPVPDRAEMVERVVKALNDERDARLRRWTAGNTDDLSFDVDENFRRVAQVVLDAALGEFR